MGNAMRGLIALGLLILAAPAAAQTATITITTAPCTNPPAVTPVPAPVTPSVAGGIAAARNREFSLALANFQPLAEKGDPDAQRAMGQLLMQNCTGLQDKPAAVELLSPAAGAGHEGGRNRVG